jgi:uncharacterized protein YqhQ
MLLALCLFFVAPLILAALVLHYSPVRFVLQLVDGLIDVRAARRPLMTR